MAYSTAEEPDSARRKRRIARNIGHSFRITVTPLTAVFFAMKKWLGSRVILSKLIDRVTRIGVPAVTFDRSVTAIQVPAGFCSIVPELRAALGPPGGAM